MLTSLKKSPFQLDGGGCRWLIMFLLTCEVSCMPKPYRRKKVLKKGKPYKKITHIHTSFFNLGI